MDRPQKSKNPAIARRLGAGLDTIGITVKLRRFALGSTCEDAYLCVRGVGKSLRVVRLDLASFEVLALDRVIYLSAVDGDTPRGSYAKTDLIAPNVNDSNLDIVANHNGFIFLST